MIIITCDECHLDISITNLPTDKIICPNCVGVLVKVYKNQIKTLKDDLENATDEIDKLEAKLLKLRQVFSE